LGWLLTYFSYESQAATQSAGAVQGIVLLFTIIPAFGHLLLILLAGRYRLSHQRCDEIRRELERRTSSSGAR
jgi:Na+/melibiose symporter-like transporter